MVNGIGRLARKIRRKKKKAIQHHEKVTNNVSIINLFNFSNLRII